MVNMVHTQSCPHSGQSHPSDLSSSFPLAGSVLVIIAHLLHFVPWFSSWSVNELSLRWNHLFSGQAGGFAPSWLGRHLSAPSIQQETLQTQFSSLGLSLGVFWIYRACLAAELLKKPESQSSILRCTKATCSSY